MNYNHESEWEHLRVAFEADAEALGFELKRKNYNLSGEPWGDYENQYTGYRWSGFIAGYEACARLAAPEVKK
jgi:hypothetical protein